MNSAMIKYNNKNTFQMRFAAMIILLLRYYSITVINNLFLYRGDTAAY